MEALKLAQEIRSNNKRANRKYLDKDTDPFELSSSTEPCSHMNMQQTLGHHPKPDCSQFYVQRKDPFTKIVKTVPRMAFNLEANRAAMPEHQVIEDEWRAYRSVLHNQTKQTNANLTQGEQAARIVRDSKLAGQCLGHKTESTTPYKLPEINKRDRKDKLEIDAHTGAMSSPVGYMYRRFADETEVLEENHTSTLYQRHRQINEPQLLVLPKISLDDPGKKYILPEVVRGGRSRRDKEMQSWDSQLTGVDSLPEPFHVYNEPDAIPRCMLNYDFSESLNGRTQRALAITKDRTNPKPREITPPPFVLPHGLNTRERTDSLISFRSVGRESNLRDGERGYKNRRQTIAGILVHAKTDLDKRSKLVDSTFKT